MTVVLDSSAVLAMLWGEPGADRVQSALGDSCISTVNVVEVATRLIDRGIGEDSVHMTFESLSIRIVDFDRAQALLAGLLREQTRHAGLSLGDRACLALALNEQAPVLTTDRVWADLNIGANVEIIR